MRQYRFAIAIISIIFIVLAIADMHTAALSGGCYNAAGQLVACSMLSSPNATPTSASAVMPPQISRITGSR